MVADAFAIMESPRPLWMRRSPSFSGSVRWRLKLPTGGAKTQHRRRWKSKTIGLRQAATRVGRKRTSFRWPADGLSREMLLHHIVQDKRCPMPIRVAQNFAYAQCQAWERNHSTKFYASQQIQPCYACPQTVSVNNTTKQMTSNGFDCYTFFPVKHAESSDEYNI